MSTLHVPFFVQCNAGEMMTAPLTKLAKTMSASTRAHLRSAAAEQDAKPRGTRAFVLVHQDYKAMPMLLALKWVASQMTTVPMMRNVTSSQGSVCSSASAQFVHQVLAVRPIITERPAHVTTHCKATDTHPVYHVSPNAKKSIHHGQT